MTSKRMDDLLTWLVVLSAAILVGAATVLLQ